MRFLLTCLIIAALASPAVACINDIELPFHEREFRSQYRAPANPPAIPSTEPTGPSNPSLILGVGGVLLTGATALTVTGRRTRN